MKGTIVPIKPEVVVKVIECGPLRIGGHVRIMFSDGSMVIKHTGVYLPLWKIVESTFLRRFPCRRLKVFQRIETDFENESPFFVGRKSVYSFVLHSFFLYLCIRCKERLCLGI